MDGASAGKKTHLLRHFILNMIILPRQARDKHRENSEQGCVVLQTGALNHTANVTRGSYVTFQVAVFVPANKTALNNLTMQFKGPWLKELSPTCINLEGVDQNNRSFTKTDVSVQAGQVYSLWVGVDGISEAALPGTEYRGSVVFGASGGVKKEVAVLLRVNSESPWPNRGDNDPDRYTRLRWLNSQRAQVRKTASFPYVCPEPVLAKCSFL
jgi:hypothetical protein